MKKGFLVKSAEWIEKNNLILAQQIGPVFLTVMAVWVGIWAPERFLEFQDLGNEKSLFFWFKKKTLWLFFLSIIIALYGGIFGAIDSRKKDRKINDLESIRNEFSQLRNLIEDAEMAYDKLRINFQEAILKFSSKFLGYLSKDCLDYNDSERISLYLYGKNKFILAGRYSKHPNYNKPNRLKFPENEGCIGQTWQHGGEYFVELPENEKEYYDYLKNSLNIDKGTAKSLRMRSISYYSLALEDGYKRIGVIIFESLYPNILEKKKIKETISNHQGFLIEILKHTRQVNSFIKLQNEDEK